MNIEQARKYQQMLAKRVPVNTGKIPVLPKGALPPQGPGINYRKPTAGSAFKDWGNKIIEYFAAPAEAVKMGLMGLNKDPSKLANYQPKWITPEKHGTTADIFRTQAKNTLAVGSLATAAMSPVTALQGAALSSGGQAYSNIKQKKNIFEGLDAAAVRGVENSAILAVTNVATDKILGGIAKHVGPQLSKKLTGLVGSNVQAPFKYSKTALDSAMRNKAFKMGVERVIARALSEVPMESIAFGTKNAAENKENLIKSIINDIPGNIMGNLLFAGLNVGAKGADVYLGSSATELKRIIDNNIRRFKNNERGAIVPGAKIGGEDIKPQEVKGGDLISEARNKSAEEFVSKKLGVKDVGNKSNSDVVMGNNFEFDFGDGKIVNGSIRETPTEIFLNTVGAKNKLKGFETVKGEGIGTKVVNALKDYADATGKRLIVPDATNKALPYWEKIPFLQRDYGVKIEGMFDDGRIYTPPNTFSYTPSKSQLTDIWNQANKVGGVPEGYKKLYHVTTPESAKAIRETGVPEVPSGRGFFAFNNKQYAEEWARISGEKSEIVEVTAKPWNIKNPESRMKTVTQKDGKPLYDVVFSKDDFIPNKPKQIKIKSPETKIEPVKQQSIEEAFPKAEIEKSLEDEIRQSANIKEPSFIPRKIEEPKLNVLQKIKQSWNRVFDPKATLPKNSQEAVTKWNATQQMAKTDANYLEREGNLVASKVGIQDPELKEKLLYYSQNPTESSAKELDLSPEVIKQAQPYLNWHKEFNDEIFSMYKEGLLDAKGNPINIGYLKNHVFQLFEERPEIIEKLIKDKGLSTFPGFAKHRIIPDFQTAKKLGLHPKYTTMEQLDAALLEVFGKSKANIDFSKYLAETGDLVAFGDAPSNWQPITSRFFPKAPNGEIFYASPDLAKTLNNIFGADTTKSFIDRGLETTAKISGTMQDVKLTGGAYTINAFTIGQTIRDTALGLGEIAKLHPIKGGKIIEASWETMFRNLTPGASQRFELNPDNKQAVKELINEGWNYGGDLNYRKAQPNTSISKDLKDSIKGEGLKNTWDEISNRPTFRKYLWQKRVDIFKIVRDDLVSKGKSYDEAVRLAAANTKNYEGVISDLGRDKSVQNFLQTFVMAPKYREGLLKSGQNIVKGFTTQIKNPEFAQSRSLGIGMGLLFVLYNQLNRKFNEGKHLWENPPGKELELVIPDGEGGYTSIPFMPGTTAIYRRAFGSIAALYKGDVQEAGKQASSLLSIPVSGISTLVTGKDYWGNDVYDPNRPSVLGNGPASKAEQMGIQTVKSFAPGYVEQPIQYAQDLASYKYRKDVLKKNATEPNKIKYGLRALEIPVKQGTFSPAYFTAKDEVLKKYSKEDVAAYEATHPTTGTFERKEPKTDIEKMKINLYKATNPNIYMMEKEIALKEAELSKKEVDPLYKVPMEVALRMYKYDSYEPGSKDKKDYGKAHPEIFELKDLRAGFFERNPIDGGTPYNGPVASEYVQKQMDLKNWKDPQVQEYLDANRAYTNERRAALGLNPLDEYSWGSGYKSSYDPMKYFHPKIKVLKMKKLRLKKLPKIKKAKRKTYKKIATKKITIKPIKGIKIKKPKSIGKIKVRS